MNRQRENTFKEKWKNIKNGIKKTWDKVLDDEVEKKRDHFLINESFMKEYNLVRNDTINKREKTFQ